MPDNSDDESGAEDAPLLARAATIASKSDNDIEDLISSPEALNNLRTRSLASFCFKGLPWVVALVVIEVIIVRAESAVQFPYLRSLQRCVRPVVPAAIHGHEGWSGSVHCLDRSAVARMAQAESNYVQGIGQLVHTASLPLLGWFADRFGRRPLVVLAFAGLLAEAVMNWAVQRIDVLFLSVAVQMGTNGLTPALMAMIADGTHPDDRLGAYLICLLAAVPAHAGVYVAVTHFVLAEHLAYYERTWGVIACLATVGLLVALSTPETLHAPGQGGGGGDDGDDGDDGEGYRNGAPKGGPLPQHQLPGRERLPPPWPPHAVPPRAPAARVPGGRGTKGAGRMCGPAYLLAWCCGGLRDGGGDGGSGSLGEQIEGGVDHVLHAVEGGRDSLCAPCGVPALRYLMLVEVPLLLGTMSLSTLDGFALIAYAWEQETMYYVRLASWPASGLAILLSLPLLRLVGPRRTLQLGVLSLCLALPVACLAQWHSHLLFLALVLAGGVALGVLPALRLVATQVPPAQQAAATATVLAVGHGAKAVGLAMHAYLFEAAAARGLLYAPFALGACFAWLALAVAVLFPPPDDAWRSSPHAAAYAARERREASGRLRIDGLGMQGAREGSTNGAAATASGDARRPRTRDD